MLCCTVISSEGKDRKMAKKYSDRLTESPLYLFPSSTTMVIFFIRLARKSELYY